MKVECKDLEFVLREDTPELTAALEEHARTCLSCREALESWKELSRAARGLRRDWESPDLWPRISRALAEEGEQPKSGTGREVFPHWSFGWRTAAAAAVFLLFSATLIWVLMRGQETAIVKNARPGSDTERRLLTEEALDRVEASEAAYIRDIESLSRLVRSGLENADSPLMAAYREKLVLIDAAIADCREAVERNRFNAHLRAELLSMYRDKRQTLEDILRIDKNELR